MNSSLTLSWESFSEAEAQVSDDPASYKGLDPRALCTSVEDVQAIIDDPLVKGNWVDLGSGFGHTVLTYAHRFPERKAMGVEKEESRIQVARNLAKKNHLPCEFIHSDLLLDPIPDGDTYFLYFPQGHVLDRILALLSHRKDFTLIAIESHGDLFPRLEKEKWLKLAKEIPLKDSRHYGFARIYRPEGSSSKLAGLHEVSFLERFLLISDKSGDWIGDSFGLYASGDDYMLAVPPRTVREENVVKIMTREELHPVLQFLVSLRSLPKVTISSQNKIYQGPLRKIIVAGTFSVEFPGGERVEWNLIDWIKQDDFLCYDSSSRSPSLPPAHS